MLGRLMHYCVDLFLISVALAGIKRSTGLSPALSRIAGKDLRQLMVSYLEMGEYAFDFAVVVMGRSNAFERKR